MKLKVIRKEDDRKACIGELYIDDIFFCYTLEDTDRLSRGEPKIFGETAIPKGTYPVIISKSTRFSQLAGKDIFLPEILSIIGYVGVRIHGGNKPEDTEGCILVGLTKEKDFIGMSQVALQKLMVKLQGQKDITIEIV